MAGARTTIYNKQKEKRIFSSSSCSLSAHPQKRPHETKNIIKSFQPLTQIKEIISNLLAAATEADDFEEAADLKDDTGITNEDDRCKQDVLSTSPEDGNNKDESNPFGLDALTPNRTKKDNRTRVKKNTTDCIRKEEEEESKRSLKGQREVLTTCLEIAACCYKTPWCQTAIEILVKHAFNNVARFTSTHRGAIEILGRDQQTRWKQGKSVTGKLDIDGLNGFNKVC